MSNYGYTKQTDLAFPEAVSAAREALAKEGFGIPAEINVAESVEKKVGESIEPYIILGACDPVYANQALKLEKELGLLLPCNVIVYSSEGSVYVSAVVAAKLLSVAGNPALDSLAEEIQPRLNRAVDAVSSKQAE